VTIAFRATGDIQLCAAILSRDPFQFALPCWNRYTTQLLPPQTRRISIEEFDAMPIRTVPVTEAPARLHVRASLNQDFQDVLSAIKDPANKGRAIVVTLGDPSWTTALNRDKSGPKYPKPAVALANQLRRHFQDASLNIAVYQSGPMEVTVRAMTQSEIANRGKGGRPRKK
jgi:hypothetical protein